jgi:hypothetical protein
MPPVSKPESALPPVELPTPKAELKIVVLDDDGKLSFYQRKTHGIIARIMDRLSGRRPS